MGCAGADTRKPVTMSQALLLLLLSMSGFVPMDSFVVGPDTLAGIKGRVDQHRCRSSAQFAITRKERVRRGRNCVIFGGGGQQLPPCRAAGADARAPEPQQGKRGPRSHVPVTEEGKYIGDDIGVGAGARGSQKDLSPLPAPTFQDRLKFEKIIDDVLGVEKEEELPGLLTKHLDFLLSVDVTRLTNDLISQEPTMDRIQTLHGAYDFIVTFLEGVVESTLKVQKTNRDLLREIIEVAKVGPVEFEQKMKELEDRFTYEFVKYLDTEVGRLEKNTSVYDGPEGGEAVLNVMKIVRTRVCAQVDLMMGEDVAILTRMLSYEDRYMMRAALRTVFKSKPLQTVEAFGRLVTSTLKDVRSRGAGVDPLLRHKLADMKDDVVALTELMQEKEEEGKATYAGQTQ